MILIGIDPGKQGGIARILVRDSVLELETFQLSKMSLLKIHDLFEDYKTWSEKFYGFETHILMEQVTGYVAKSKNEETGEDYNRGDRSFQFGRSYGQLEMAIIGNGFAEGIDFNLVHPRVWQNAMGLKREKSENQSQWKRRMKIKAQEIWPSVKITLATSDAVLIATYLYRKVTGTLSIRVQPDTSTEEVDL